MKKIIALMVLGLLASPSFAKDTKELSVEARIGQDKKALECKKVEKDKGRVVAAAEVKDESQVEASGEVKLKVKSECLKNKAGSCIPGTDTER